MLPAIQLAGNQSINSKEVLQNSLIIIRPILKGNLELHKMQGRDKFVKVMILMIFLCPVGMLTISDFINILRYYYKSPLVRIVLNSNFFLKLHQSPWIKDFITFSVIVESFHHSLTLRCKLMSWRNMISKLFEVVNKILMLT